MELTVMRPVKLQVDAIRVTVPVPHAEDLPADFPGLRGEVLTLTLDLHWHRVRDWPLGRVESLNIKVRDEGRYELLARGTTVAVLDDWYVPSCVPGEGVGDYLVMRIGTDGTVYGWYPKADDVAEDFATAAWVE